MSATCARCGAEILWAITTKGKRMPVDIEPTEAGNLAIYRDHVGGLHARVVKPNEPVEPYERPGIAHFATCPGVPEKPRQPAVPSLAAKRDEKRRREFAARRGIRGPA